MLHIKHILCPTDFSEYSNYALSLATSFAKEHDAEIHIVHVYQGLFAYTDGDELGFIPPADMEPAKESLEKIKPRDGSVRFRRKFVVGEPTFELVEYAKQEHIDLIVMGTHGWTGLDRLLMGSVAESVVRRAPCPVLTLKHAATKLESA